MNTASYENNFLNSTALTRTSLSFSATAISKTTISTSFRFTQQYMFELVEHLKEQGYTPPSSYAVWRTIQTRTMRRKAFWTPCRRYSVRRKGRCISCEQHLNIDAYSQLVGLCKTRFGRYSAIIGVNSVTTARAFHAIQQMRLRIPATSAFAARRLDWETSSIGRTHFSRTSRP